MSETTDTTVREPLVDDPGTLLAQWNELQTRFVDDPRRSVEQADQLVSDTTNRIVQRFANERATLEQQWSGGEDVSTEDLRVALQRYRSFFNRLLER